MRKEPQSPSFPSSHMSSQSWRTLVSHIGHSLESVIAVACNFSPCEPHQNKECTTSATPALCDSKQSVHLFSSFVQHLHWYFLCASFSVTPPRSQRVRGGGIALLQYLARITLKSSAQKRTECEEKPSSSLPGVRSRVRLHHQIFSRHQCRHPSRGILEQLSIRVCSKIAAKTCS